MVRASTCASILTAVLAWGALGACSLFVDTDGLSGGGDDIADPATDASSDATADRDATALDSGADADASASPYCVSHPGHTLCLDFDESPSLPAFDTSSFDPGHMFVDDATSVSPQQSLAILFSGGHGSNQSIDKDLPPTKSVLSISLDVRYSASDLSQGQTITFSVDVPHVAGLSDHFFYLQTYFGDLALVENVTPDDGGASDFPSITLISPVPPDTWMHIEMSVDGATRKWTMSFNGVALADGQAEVGFPSGPAHFTLGGYGSPQLPADTTVHIDNLLVDY